MEFLFFKSMFESLNLLIFYEIINTKKWNFFFINPNFGFMSFCVGMWLIKKYLPLIFSNRSQGTL
ncbi:hypothetical protein B6I21_04715 [candidate division KSB1 bacterium 4572_119]|nr:MAG: hypothetical protein B6I21_04715 [candidate division KSB1 bacterium 4572_119]